MTTVIESTDWSVMFITDEEGPDYYLAHAGDEESLAVAVRKIPEGYNCSGMEWPDDSPLGPDAVLACFVKVAQ